MERWDGRLRTARVGVILRTNDTRHSQQTACPQAEEVLQTKDVPIRCDTEVVKASKVKSVHSAKLVP